MNTNKKPAPEIVIETNLMGLTFLEGGTLEKLYKEPLETLKDVLDQIKQNLDRYSFIFVDKQGVKELDKVTVLDSIFFELPLKGQVTTYVKKESIFMQVNFIKKKDQSPIQILPLPPLATRLYEDKEDIDTAYYIDLALKFTEGLAIEYSFIARNF